MTHFRLLFGYLTSFDLIFVPAEKSSKADFFKILGRSRLFKFDDSKNDVRWCRVRAELGAELDSVGGEHSRVLDHCAAGDELGRRLLRLGLAKVKMLPTLQ